MAQFKLDKFLDDEEKEELLYIDWDFKSANTREYTHGIHVYPARMVPQIARLLIKRFSEPRDLVLDPFCGSGTVLLEAAISNRNSVGVDINPLAALISKAKTNPLDPDVLKRDLEKISNEIKNLQNLVDEKAESQ